MVIDETKHFSNLALFAVDNQVMVEATLGKNLKSVVTKIAIQMNCKLGGEAWASRSPVRQHSYSCLFMFVSQTNKHNICPCRHRV